MTSPVDLTARFSQELTRVLSAILEAHVSSRRAESFDHAGYRIAVRAAEGTQANVEIYFARDGAEAVAKWMGALAIDPSVGEVCDSLREVCGQTLTALSDRHLPGSRFVVASVDPVARQSIHRDNRSFDIVFEGHEQVLHIAVSGDFDAQSADGDGQDRSSALDVILDIDLPLTVRFGRTEMSLKSLTAVAPGSVIDLGRSPDEPVDVLVSNQVVAKGEVVIVNGNYGVRIREVISPAERVRSLEVGS